MIHRKLPVGAEVLPGRGTHFRVWAPRARKLAVELYSAAEKLEAVQPLEDESNGYFSGVLREVAPGALYKFRLEAGSFPDPASRFQPFGVHGPSQVVDAAAFRWTDQEWRGRPVREHVIYEMHIGTFTPEGTWRAAIEQLPELQRLGVTMIEVMPLAEFPGEFGWGYDGVDLFAPTRLYGGPDDVRAFVNRAHELRLMVILDVVYNHLGPDGNYLGRFSEHYFSTTHTSDWGDALNFDGENSGPVREFFVSNARYWISEFHCDGLRLDATQQIFDASTPHILAEVAQAAREAGGGRHIYIVGENEPQLVSLTRPAAQGGCGLDALWNDDYHHSAVVAATGRAEAYYIDYRGAPQEFVSAIKYGFLYQGQWYNWQRNRRGAAAFAQAPTSFVIFLQNHDQLANTLRGQRLHQSTSPGMFKALTALTLLAPQTPMLFQGQEFAASTPFLYFADHTPELKERVSRGRREFLLQFRTIAAEESRVLLAEPGDAATFRRCKLDFAERQTNRPIYRLHEELLRLRREDPTLRDCERVDGAVLGDDAFVIRYFSPTGDDRLLLVNFGADLFLNPAPEPLLAPVEAHGWAVLWSSEAPDYGGYGTPDLETKSGWIIPGRAAVVMQPDEARELPTARITQND